MLYVYKCKITNIVDGDTIDVDIDLGFSTWLHNERIRIAGIDCPETRTRDPIEKVFGNLAKERVEELLPIGEIFYLKSIEYRRGSFGRILGDILFDLEGKRTLTNILLEERHAVVWQPNNRPLMEQQEIENRNWLLEFAPNREEIKERVSTYL